MKQGKVIGRVFCTVQCPTVDGKTLLLVEPLGWESGKPCGEPFVAADCVGAGAGETIFYVQSREAAVAYPDSGNRMNLIETHSAADLIRSLGWAAR